MVKIRQELFIIETNQAHGTQTTHMKWKFRENVFDMQKKVIVQKKKEQGGNAAETSAKNI